MEVVPLGLGVLRMGDRREARRGGLGEAVVLAAGGGDEAVERVVGEALGGVGVGVVEVDAGLGEVADPGDVADGGADQGVREGPAGASVGGVLQSGQYRGGGGDRGGSRTLKGTAAEST